jgi:hypothetical protein
MTGQEYETHMGLVAGAVRVLLMVPLEELLGIVQHAETVGPILHPGEFQRGGGENLVVQRDVLEAALVLRRAAERHDPARTGSGGGR